jgi:hypothetical protein
LFFSNPGSLAYKLPVKKKSLSLKIAFPFSDSSIYKFLYSYISPDFSKPWKTGRVNNRAYLSCIFLSSQEVGTEMNKSSAYLSSP